MIQSAEQLKQEADRLEESARKIAAAEPIPPNSKAAAEAIASTPHSQEKIHPEQFEANAAAAIPKTDNVDEGGENLGSEDHPAGPMQHTVLLTANFLSQSTLHVKNLFTHNTAS